MEVFISDFRYQPLDTNSKQIRLVTLEPAGHLDSPIRYTLHTADLGAQLKPKFEALSYVWGDATVTLPIQLDHHQDFPVTVNLERALRHLRRPGNDWVLWVDAICIDQDSVTERSHQVQQMGDIYSEAALVHAWLGDDLEIASLFRIITVNHLNEWWEFSLELQNNVDRFVGNDYWKRAWIT
jgi:hypothetical protein